MSGESKIEWTDATWNPVTGCTEVSPGCDHCYAKTFAERWRGIPGHHFEQGFDVVLRPERLDQPLRWRKPRRIFVNSMSDLFHDDIPDEYIARVWAVMASAYMHTFQVLTKRHGRMRSLLNSPAFWDLFDREWCGIPDWVNRWPDPDYIPAGHTYHLKDGPLSNVWLGVSVENQQWADIRVRALLGTPAAVRFLSCEPLLGPVDLAKAIEPNFAVSGWKALSGLDWVIVGGESGRGARPMHPDWARSLRDQCTAAGVAFHFKQWGQWVTEDQSPEDILLPATSWSHLGEDQPAVWNVGKGNAGRELDGRTWDEFPPETPLSSRRRADAGTPAPAPGTASRGPGSSTRASATAAGQGNPIVTADEKLPTGPRANDCVEQLHTHVGICQRTGYANGWADAMEAIAPGKCTHVPPSPGQSLCQCRHQQIEMEYAARIAETQPARSSDASAEHPQEPPC